MATLYDVLGVPAQFNPTELRAAFKRHALLVHPDKGGSKEAFQKVMFAFELLSDPERRHRYEKRLGLNTTQSTKARQPDQAATKHVAKKEMMRCSEKQKLSTCSENNCRTNSSDKQEVQGSVSKNASPTGSDSCRSTSPVAARKWSWEQKRAQRVEQTIRRIFQLLRALPEKNRRKLLTERFSQPQRLALERWANHGTASSSQPQKEASRSAPHLQKVANYGATEHLLAVEDSDTSSTHSEGETSAEDMLPVEYPDSLHRGAHDNGEYCVGVEALGARVPALSQTGEQTSSKMKGLHTAHKDREHPSYYTTVSYQWLWLSSRSTGDLSKALDAHLILTDVVNKMKASDHKCLAGRLEHAINASLKENRISAQSIGLGVHCRIQRIFWLGKSTLYTPVWHSLTIAKYGIMRLQPFMPRKGDKPSFSMLKSGRLDEMRRAWEDLKCQYVNICAESGWDQQRIISKLADWELRSGPRRERMWERWSRWAMHRQDPHLLVDRSCRRGASSITRELRVCKLLEKWDQHESKARARQAAQMQAARAREVRDRASSARRAEANAAAKVKKSKREPKAYKDLTMDEILSSHRD